MSIQHLTANLSLPTGEVLRLAYLDSPPIGDNFKGTILLIHGFPQTSYQYRHVLPLLSAQGYRCIAPDYRGAGHSSQPESDYRKTTMAKDIIALLDHLNIVEKIHLIGHDIGGKIAFALATRHAERFRSVVWGENVLPGTEAYVKSRTVPEQTVLFFHFIFHCVSPLAETLVEGKEKLYIEHFFHKLSHNLSAFSDDVVEHYAKAYSQPGAMRAAMAVYKAFEEDHKENIEWIKKEGKCNVPSFVLTGEKSWVGDAVKMGREVTVEEVMEVGVVKGAGHYVAEENPEGFVDVVVEFIGRH
ncbi:hypothetical protein PRZ48_011023 [Zasmidium cellare]|uniref:AB hydrolase-1 domain-containing protein n=1 Tax=Zasmidium cellare TaxID=395010 RepID=A0ABR0EAA1_ZASCE|nr:hypothetical protein PRZ48_011023 [Zasmidium cellare]